MEQSITTKIKLNPTLEQQTLLNSTMSVYRDACNFVSQYIFQTHILDQKTLHKDLYFQIRETFNLKSQMTQSVLKTVISKYKSICGNNQEWTLPIFKKPQIDLVWNRDYSLVKNLFSINTLSGRIKISFIQTGMEKYFNRDVYKFGTAKITNKHGKYFLHIPVTFEIEDSLIQDICNVVGIDRGINFIVATYDSNNKSTFVSGKFIKNKRIHYSNLRAELQCKNTVSSKRRLRLIGRRENRWMQDVNHQVSKALVQNNPKHTLFVLEDLTNIRNATEKTRLKDRYVSVSWPYYDLEQKLIYKAQQNQCSVIKVNPAYTSQTCPKCGHTEKANRNKKLHIFKCKNCGYQSNDDRIGAMNLYRMGIEYIVPDTVANE